MTCLESENSTKLYGINHHIRLVGTIAIDLQDGIIERRLAADTKNLQILIAVMIMVILKVKNIL